MWWTESYVLADSLTGKGKKVKVWTLAIAPLT